MNLARHMIDMLTTSEATNYSTISAAASLNFNGINTYK